MSEDEGMSRPLGRGYIPDCPNGWPSRRSPEISNDLLPKTRIRADDGSVGLQNQLHRDMGLPPAFEFLDSLFRCMFLV